MDVTSLKIGAALEKGAALHLKHPILEHLMYSGEGADKYGRLVDKKKPHKAIRLILKHPEAPSVIDAMREIDRIKATGEDVSVGTIGVKYFFALLVGWEGIGVNGEDESECTEFNAKAFFDSEFGDMVGKRQVIPFVTSGKNFAANFATA